MNALDDGETVSTAATTGVRPWFVVVAILLCGLLILAHGCHGDEDHELFNAVQSAISP